MPYHVWIRGQGSFRHYRKQTLNGSADTRIQLKRLKRETSTTYLRLSRLDDEVNNVASDENNDIEEMDEDEVRGDEDEDNGADDIKEGIDAVTVVDDDTDDGNDDVDEGTGTGSDVDTLECEDADKKDVADDESIKHDADDEINVGIGKLGSKAGNIRTGFCCAEGDCMSDRSKLAPEGFVLLKGRIVAGPERKGQQELSLWMSKFCSTSLCRSSFG